MNGSSNTSSVLCITFKCNFSLAERTTIISTFVLLFVASLVGNILILFLLKKDSQLRSKTSPSHISLAIADLLVTIFCLPIMVMDLYIYERWIFGAVLCKVVTFIQTLSYTSSIFNLCIVASECFTAVCFPFYLRFLRGKRTILIISCVVAWLMAMAEGVMYAQFKIYDIFDGIPYCYESWPSGAFQKNFLYTHAFLAAIIPVTYIIILNLLSVVRLCKAKNWDLHSNRRSSKTSYTRIATKKIIVISLIFIICRTPSQVLSVAYMNDHNLDMRTFVTIYTMCYILYFFSASTHPIVFGLMSSYYKDAIKKHCRLHSKRKQTSKNSSKGVQSSRIVDTAQI